MIQIAFNWLDFFFACGAMRFKTLNIKPRTNYLNPSLVLAQSQWLFWLDYFKASNFYTSPTSILLLDASSSALVCDDRILTLHLCFILWTMDDANLSFGFPHHDLRFLAISYSIILFQHSCCSYVLSLLIIKSLHNYLIKQVTFFIPTSEFYLIQQSVIQNQHSHDVQNPLSLNIFTHTHTHEVVKLGEQGIKCRMDYFLCMCFELYV